VIVGVHHVGLVVRDIKETASLYGLRFGYQPRTEIIHDATQTAYVQFLQVPGDPVYLELVSPDRDDSKLTRALNKGGGLNHICYSTSDIESTCQQLRAEQMMLLQAPVEAAAFPGRRIAWMIGLDRIPIELVERGRPGEL
jgi:methylmalonyl-CoA/ethylmalonyl-CoA epimerase